MQWHYVRDGKPVGPVDEAEVKQLVSTGVLLEHDYVWNPGMGANWALISNVPEFKAQPVQNEPQPQIEQVVESRPLKFAPQARHESSPAIKAQAESFRVTQETAKTSRRRFWGYSCPQCGDRVHRAKSEGAQRWFGLIGLMLYAAFGPMECDRCGEMRRREFPFQDQVRMLFGTLSLIGFAIVVLILLLWLWSIAGENPTS